MGVAYSQAFAASGGTPPYAWSVPASSPLPPGLELSQAGVLLGVPGLADNFHANVPQLAASDAQRNVVDHRLLGLARSIENKLLAGVGLAHHAAASMELTGISAIAERAR